MDPTRFLNHNQMKTNRLFFILAAILFISVACGPDIDIPDQDDDTGNGVQPGDINELSDVPYPTAGGPKVPTLLTTGYFSEQVIAEGITLYSLEKTEDVTNKPQSVRVLEVDLDNPNYKIVFKSLAPGRSITSAQGKASSKTIACVNAAYEQDAIYNKTNGAVFQPDNGRVEPGHLRFWKHEAALVGDGKRKVGIIYGAKGFPTTAQGIKAGGIQAYEIYEKLTEPNIFASAPMLIDNYLPVGTTFVPSAYDGSNFSGLDGEDYRRHQGVRHPRTAVALTADNDLLLITVDGRYDEDQTQKSGRYTSPAKAVGMSARELTNFIAKHFNPQWAINMDGGGSTSLYIKGKGIVNHVCNDGSTWTTPVERQLSTFLLVQTN